MTRPTSWTSCRPSARPPASPTRRTRGGIDIHPVSGTSLLPASAATTLPERALAFEHQQARGLRKGDWKLVWGKRQPDERPLGTLQPQDTTAPNSMTSPPEHPEISRN